MPSDGWEMKGELPHQRMLRIALNPEKELLGHWRNMSFDLDINIFWYNMQMTYHCTLMHHQTTQLLWTFPLPTREISPIFDIRIVYWSDWSILSILIKLAKRWSSISNYNVVKTVPFAPSTAFWLQESPTWQGDEFFGSGKATFQFVELWILLWIIILFLFWNLCWEVTNPSKQSFIGHFF